LDKCCVCGESTGKKDSIPICKKKACIKEFVRDFGHFCQGVNEQLGMESEGFIFNNKLIRYGHFEEDFEKIWKENDPYEPDEDIEDNLIEE